MQKSINKLEQCYAHATPSQCEQQLKKQWSRRGTKLFLGQEVELHVQQRRMSDVTVSRRDRAPTAAGGTPKSKDDENGKRDGLARPDGPIREYQIVRRLAQRTNSKAKRRESREVPLNDHRPDELRLVSDAGLP
jgi:hypothetical protein